MPKKPAPAPELSDDEEDQFVSQRRPGEPSNRNDLRDQIDEPAPAPAPVIAEPKKYAKGKGKERTPAQKEAFSKALSILKEKREAKVRDEKERYEKADKVEKDRIEKEKYEKAKNHKKRLPPVPSYITTSDLEKFKLEILGAIPKMEQPKPIEPVKQVKKEPEPVVAEPVVVPKRKAEPVVQKTLTGHDLLDKIFFN